MTVGAVFRHAAAAPALPRNELGKVRRAAVQALVS